MVDRIEMLFEANGWGLWATEVAATEEFIGFVGLMPWDELFDEPMVEVGWRLAAAHWGQGYATEAAIACLDHGFNRVGLDEIVSLTATINGPSQRIMQKIGMITDPSDDFDHPRCEGALRPHVLYRAQRSSWTAPSS